MKIRKGIALLIAVVFLLPSVCLSSEASSHNDGYIEKTQSINAALIGGEYIDSPSNVTIFDKHYESASIRVGINMDCVYVTLFSPQGSQNIVLSGESTFLRTENSSGYVGLYVGTWISDETLNVEIPVVVDLVFSEDDLFAAITIDSASAQAAPTIIFLGELNDDLGDISTQHSLEQARNWMEDIAT